MERLEIIADRSLKGREALGLVLLMYGNAMPLEQGTALEDYCSWGSVNGGSQYWTCQSSLYISFPGRLPWHVFSTFAAPSSSLTIALHLSLR